VIVNLQAMNSDNHHSPPPPYSEEKTAHITIADSFPPAPQYLPQQQPSAPTASPTNFHQPHPHIVHANTGSFGPLPVELDCPYCQVNWGRSNKTKDKQRFISPLDVRLVIFSFLSYLRGLKGLIAAKKLYESKAVQWEMASRV
jgi:hypothetical protein